MRRFVFSRLLGGFLWSLGGIFLIILVLTIFIQREIGTLPSALEQKSFEGLSYFQDGKFQSRHPIRYCEKPGDKNIFMRFFLDKPLSPPRAIPLHPVKTQDYMAPPGELRLTWLGHSSIILEVDGTRVLIDPVLNNAGPLPFIVRRFQKSPLNLEDIPPLDAILISHDHYDHLERSTVLCLAQKGIPFIVPLGVGARLRGWGIPAHQITELAWQTSHTLKSLTIHALPTRHYSARFNYDRNRTLWASYAIIGPKHKVFFSGDGGYDEGFREIGEKWGPFDLTCIEVGAANERWPNTHLFPQEAIQAHKDLRGNYMLPIHWCAYDLALHPWDKPIRETLQYAQKENINLITPEQGEPCLPKTHQSHHWWELIK